MSIESISTEIIDTSIQLGRLEVLGIQGGCFDFSRACQVKCTGIVKRYLEWKESSLQEMKGGLQKVYLKLHSMQKECSEVFEEKVAGIFENQIKMLHEKRGMMDTSLRSFESYMENHCELNRIVDEVKKIEHLILDQELKLEEADLASEMIQDMLLRMKLIFSEKKENPFDAMHKKQKEKLGDDLNLLNCKLNLRRNEMRHEVEIKDKQSIQSLLSRFEKLISSSQKISSGDEEIQSLISGLPLNFRIALYKQAVIFPENLLKEEKELENFSNHALCHQRMLEIGGIAGYRHEKGRKEYEEFGGKNLSFWGLQKGLSEKLPSFSVEDPEMARNALQSVLVHFPKYIPEKEPVLQISSIEEVEVAIKQMRELEGEEREKGIQRILEESEKGGVSLNASKGVYYWVWWFAHETDPNVGGDDFGKGQAPKDLDRLLLAIEMATPRSSDALLKLQLTSLRDLQLRVMQVANTEYVDEERVLSELLEEAEKKGIGLDRPQGVYYWVWWLAHEKDPKAGGDHFGKIQAPKDIERLLQAISKADI